jgi:hypothetical protein
MKLLSIDWDYFFPCSDYYDWGANEENSLFYEMVWSTRCHNKHMVTHHKVLDEYLPTVPENFWSIVKNRPPLFIADSHLLILDVIKTIGFSEGIIHNLDAHHDYFYQYDDSVKIDCSNWGKYVLTERIAKELHLHYPKWRRQSKEDYELKLTSVSYDLPDVQDYDAVFICRSSCWTPPWSDSDFDNFVVKPDFDIECLDSRLLVERHPNIQEAKVIAEQMDKIISEMMKGTRV